MARELCDFEIEILQECAGQKAPRSWGAAVGAALESLRGNGYVNRAGQITEKGREYLRTAYLDDRESTS